MLENIVKARGYIVFIVGLIIAFSLVIWIERASGTMLIARSPAIEPSADIALRPAPRSLTEEELEWGRIAWKYFEINTDPGTGLVDSVAAYPAATMWDTGSYLLALLAARDLEIISRQEFDRRVTQALSSLERIDLFDGVLPNKSYSTRTLAMVDYTNVTTGRGIGWSAIDISRLLVSFNVIAWHFPEHTQEVTRVISRWDTRRLAGGGEFFGGKVLANGQTAVVQEGRLGYEQYAAKTFTLMGLDATAALAYARHLAFVGIYGIDVPYDDRNPKLYGAHNYVVSEPYVLDGLEFGWDAVSRELAWRVFRAQEARFRATGRVTAATEDHIDKAPYFVYNTIYSDGRSWNAITDTGADASAFRAVSVKAAFAWRALYECAYSRKLLQTVLPLRDPARGWFSGVYEVDGKPNKALNTNTNAVVLESLAFMKRGPVIRYRQVD